jgi:magnesium chelatase family protein
VETARQYQQERFKDYPNIFANGDMGAGEIQQFCAPIPEAKQLLELSIRKMRLSARSYHRILKLSRTIADLDNNAQIQVAHVAEALQYRPPHLD